MAVLSGKASERDDNMIYFILTDREKAVAFALMTYDRENK